MKIKLNLNKKIKSKLIQLLLIFPRAELEFFRSYLPFSFSHFQHKKRVFQGLVSTHTNSFSRGNSAHIVWWPH